MKKAVPVGAAFFRFWMVDHSCEIMPSEAFCGIAGRQGVLSTTGGGMKVFFDVDGVLTDGWHADPSRRRPWDETIEADLGVDRQAFQDLFFGTAGNRASSGMMACVTGRSDLKTALAEVLPHAGYAGSVDAFMRYWFERDSSLQTEVIALASFMRSQGLRTFVATGQEHYRASYLWNELGLFEHFERMFYSADIGLLKKEAGFFEAINRLKTVEDIRQHPRLRSLLADTVPEPRL